MQGRELERVGLRALAGTSAALVAAVTAARRRSDAAPVVQPMMDLGALLQLHLDADTGNSVQVPAEPS